MYIKKIILIVISSFLCIAAGYVVVQNDKNILEHTKSEQQTKKDINTKKEGWLIDYEEVYQQSIQFQQPIMANFTGSDWCGWCKKLKKAVFDTELFKEWAKNNVILFELDYPRRTPQDPEIQKQNRDLQQAFGGLVRGFPTVLYFNIERTFQENGSKDKDNITLLPSTALVKSGQGRMGYMGDPNSFINKADAIINATSN